MRITRLIPALAAVLPSLPALVLPAWILTAKHWVSGGLSLRIRSLDQTSGGTLANGVQTHNHSSDLHERDAVPVVDPVGRRRLSTR